MRSPSWRALVGWFATIRIRTAIAAAVIVGVVLTLSSFGTVELLRSSLDANATNTAKAEALDLAYFVTMRDRVPFRLPISDEEMAAQIVDRHGVVLASSANVAGQAPMVGLQPGPGQEASLSSVVLKVRRHTHVDLDLDSHFVVTAVGLGPGAIAGVVLVANSLGATDRAVSLVARSLFLAVPLVMILMGFLVWWFVGRSLRPVERIRADVAELSVTDLSRRVSEPSARDEIGRLARTMNSMLARLDFSTGRQRQLIADVSHELRNPLATVRTQLEVVAAHPGPEHVDLVDGAIAQVDRTTQLLEDLLLLARFDEHSSPPRFRALDLDEVVFDAVDALRARDAVQVSAKGIGAARVVGDREQLRRLVTNLADNAERYARHQVSFSLSTVDGWAHLSVSDDGPGIPAAQRENVFERFVRLDDSRDHHKGGVGLGLAIVREIVVAHGGTVWVEDAEPGARFVVRLPVITDFADGTAGENGHFDDGTESPGTPPTEWTAADHSSRIEIVRQHLPPRRISARRS